MPDNNVTVQALQAGGRRFEAILQPLANQSHRFAGQLAAAVESTNHAESRVKTKKKKWLPTTVTLKFECISLSVQEVHYMLHCSCNPSGIPRALDAIRRRSPTFFV